ncbi:MAG: hypothetical protein V7L13_18405 [Nostoc sp.]|uniref:hypothetical protein n=1 Tax=Nostoc sp. TaxID=1180 RepID=UPI002FFA89CE
MSEESPGIDARNLFQLRHLGLMPFTTSGVLELARIVEGVCLSSFWEGTARLKCPRLGFRHYNPRFFKTKAGAFRGVLGCPPRYSIGQAAQLLLQR